MEGFKDVKVLYIYFVLLPPPSPGTFQDSFEYTHAQTHGQYEKKRRKKITGANVFTNSEFHSK